jgi:hypothetical protein
MRGPISMTRFDVSIIDPDIEKNIVIESDGAGVTVADGD